jgi:hypothetical protein
MHPVERWVHAPIISKLHRSARPSQRSMEDVSMTGIGITRVVGVAAIIFLGLYGGLASGSAGLDVLLVFQMLNTALLFVIMTVAYELRGRWRP